MTARIIKHPSSPSSPADIVHELLNYGPRLHQLVIAYEWVDDDGVIHTVADWSDMDLTDLVWLQGVIAARVQEKIADRIVKDAD